VALLGGTPRRVVNDIWSAPGWSPDGGRMAFVRTKGPDQETSLVVVDAEGRDERVLSTRPAPGGFLNASWGGASNRPAWSPNGKQLALARATQPSEWKGVVSAIAILEIETGREIRAIPIQEAGLAWEAAWLDDTRMLINSGTSFQSLPGLWSFDLTNDKWTPITREFAHFRSISLTADRRTALAIKTERRSSIWLGTAYGDHGSVVVPENASWPSLPVVDKAGNIIYQAYAGHGVLTLYRLASNTAKPSLLAEGGGGGFAATSDGRYIVFSRHYESPLYRVNADGTGLTALVDRDAGAPSTTPDGRTVFFSPFGSPGLYTVSIDPGQPQKLFSGFVATIVTVSPDGTRALFGSRPGISVTCALPRCSDPKELKLKGSQWAPGGQGVAYINEQDSGNLWEESLDGRPARPLTRFAEGQILEFAWSADYERLVLARGRYSEDVFLLKGLQ
jgi:Tol biopolymer transport system component